MHLIVLHPDMWIRFAHICIISSTFSLPSKLCVQWSSTCIKIFQTNVLVFTVIWSRYYCPLFKLNHDSGVWSAAHWRTIWAVLEKPLWSLFNLSVTTAHVQLALNSGSQCYLTKKVKRYFRQTISAVLWKPKIVTQPNIRQINTIWWNIKIITHFGDIQ